MRTTPTIRSSSSTTGTAGELHLTHLAGGQLWVRPLVEREQVRDHVLADDLVFGGVEQLPHREDADEALLVVGDVEVVDRGLVVFRRELPEAIDGDAGEGVLVDGDVLVVGDLADAVGVDLGPAVGEESPEAVSVPHTPHPVRGF